MTLDEEFKAKITAQIAEQSRNRALLPGKLMDSRHSSPVELSPEEGQEFAAFRRQLLASLRSRRRD